jgi:aspartate/methionine/tyrosine aminotransferase
MAAGHTFYTHTAGCTELRESIAAQAAALHGVRYTPSEIVCTVGATAAVFLAVRTFVGPGDNAVILSPAYALFANAVTIAGGEPRLVPLVRDGARFRLDADRVAHAIDRDTRLLVVNSPSNPTGWTMTTAEQRVLVELAGRHGVVILADEVYERLTYDLPIAPSFARIAKDRLIVVNSFSKTYNMTGWRLGWAQASEAVARAMYKTAEFITSNPAAMVQQAAIVALREGEDYVRDLRAQYTARRDQVVAALGAIPRVTLVEPAGGFYAFFTVDGLSDSARFCHELLTETGLALTPGSAFGDGGEGYVRMCFAAREATIAEALQRLSRFLGHRP